MKLVDNESHTLKVGDKFRVISANPQDGVPNYRVGDLARISAIAVDGVKVSYFTEPLKECCLPVRAAKHIRKV
jgi:hypothetical protein